MKWRRVTKRGLPCGQDEGCKGEGAHEAGPTARIDKAPLDWREKWAKEWIEKWERNK